MGDTPIHQLSADEFWESLEGRGSQEGEGGLVFSTGPNAMTGSPSVDCQIQCS